MTLLSRILQSFQHGKSIPTDIDYKDIAWVCLMALLFYVVPILIICLVISAIR